MFMGANGFPSRVYTPVFKHFQKLLPAVSVHLHDYHNDLNPSTCTNWHALVAKTIAKAESLADASGAPLTAVGHSAGGALFCCAASKRPDLFRDLVIVDSPLFSPRKRVLYSLCTMLPDYVNNRVHPLIRGAVNKKHVWGGIEEARSYLKGRRLFQSFDAEVFEAFLQHGLMPLPLPDNQTDNTRTDAALQPRQDAAIVAGRDHLGDVPAMPMHGPVTLAFPRMHEANMYKTTPFETPVLATRNGYLGQYDATGSKGVFAYSSRYDFLGQDDVGWLRERFPKLRFEPFDQTHMWPLQDPEAFAAFLAESV